MANDNSRNPPPPLEVGSVVKFNASKWNMESYQGTVSFFNPASSVFMLRNVTRGTDIIPAEELFFFRLWEITDLQVVETAEQILGGNTTNTQTDQNVNVGDASSSTNVLADAGLRGYARNRDSTTDTPDDDNIDGGEASKKARFDH